MQELSQHPLSAAFPAMPTQELEALAIDIEKNGQREPGVLYEGMVLDGWHRYLACKSAGRKFQCGDYAGADPVSLVISRNLHRRHLTASQRAACVVAASNWRPAGRPEKNSAAGAELSAKALADKAEVSTRTIENAKAAHKAGLGDAVREGRVSAERAAEVAKLPASKRAKAIKEPRPKKEDARDVEIKKLKARIAELDEQKSDLADTARELEDKLTAFEKTEPDEQQKEIMKLQKRVVKLEGEVERITIARNGCQNKNNELIRQVKLLQRKSGGG